MNEHVDPNPRSPNVIERTKSNVVLFFTLKTVNERFSKFENMVEGIGVYFLIVWLVFRLIFETVSPLEDFGRNVLLIYIAAIGPLIHKNSTKDLGIGNVKRIKEELFNRKHPGIITTTIILIGLSVLVFPLFFQNFNNILKLVPVLGQVNEYVANEAPAFQVPLAIGEYILFQVILIFVILRKDNLWPALKSFGKPVAIMLIVIFALSLVSLELFRVEQGLLDFFAIWYGYTFWGLMQQIPFLVYFSTRFRKGLPFKRHSEYINVALLAFFFGFFHATQWILVVIATLMEIAIARSFLHEETRNLFVAGLIHGFFGTLLIFFTGLYIKMDFV